MTHTPGPWRAEKQEDSDAYWIFAGTKNRQTEVADVWAFDSRTDPLPSQDNAHLIAAAPDMLAALQEITSCCLERASLDSNPAMKRWCKAICETARATIAKAEGRS